MSAGGPSVSVLIVSDYGGHSDEDWNYLRDTSTALRAQLFAEPVELMLVDSTAVGETMPPDLVELSAALRIVRDAGATSCELLNRGVETASADIRSRCSTATARRYRAGSLPASHACATIPKPSR